MDNLVVVVLKFLSCVVVLNVFSVGKEICIIFFFVRILCKMNFIYYQLYFICLLLMFNCFRIIIYFN